MAREGKARMLSDLEFKLLLAVATGGKFSHRNAAILYCSFGLGLRVQEIAGLKIEDIAYNNFKLKEEVCLRRAITKNRRQRYAYLSHEKVVHALQTHLDDLTKRPYDNFLFETQCKCRFSANVLQKWFRYIMDKAGLHDASSHSGRRTFITKLIQNGADIKSISTLVGHSSITTTAVYIEENPHRLKHFSNMAL